MRGNRIVFGYVLPLKSELKFREFDEFKSAYCGLCRQLRKEYGFFSSFILNYDFAFLAMLLDCTAGAKFGQCRCPAGFGIKKRCACDTRGLSAAAAVSVILTWHKLCDVISDERSVKRAFARLAKLILLRAYGKSVNKYPDYDRKVKDCLSRLASLESVKSSSIDRTADTFAEMLSCLTEENTSENRIFSVILYNIGRWIYIIDACDDLQNDCKKHNYNPVALRFEINDGSLSPQTAQQLSVTLSHSLDAAARAYELLDVKAYDGVLRNILYYGLPEIQRQILSGTRKPAQRRTFH